MENQNYVWGKKKNREKTNAPTPPCYQTLMNGSISPSNLKEKSCAYEEEPQ